MPELPWLSRYPQLSEARQIKRRQRSAGFFAIRKLRNQLARDRSERQTQMLVAKRVEHIVDRTTATNRWQVVGQGWPRAEPARRLTSHRQAKFADVLLQALPLALIRRRVEWRELNEAGDTQS